MGVIPIVNENDVVSTDQILDGNFGDNDTLSALVAKMIGADLLILLSDPRSNPDARFISCVEKIDDDLLSCAKGPESAFGTGGMTTKLAAAEIANGAGTDMVIANGDDPVNVIRILEGKEVGTLFKA